MNTVDQILETVESAVTSLRNDSDSVASNKPSPGKWSKKELLGHLIDSAANNHQRFVRAQGTSPLIFPKYEQDDWVRVQHYNDCAWSELIDFFRSYNRHLCHVVREIPAKSMQVECRIGPYDPVTLEFLIDDYLAHMQHHLRQLLT